MHKSNPRTLILQALKNGHPCNFTAIFVYCMHKVARADYGPIMRYSREMRYDPKIVQKYRKHLLALVKNNRVRKRFDRVYENIYYSLRKRLNLNEAKEGK